jgi:hypothetical protein
LVITKEQVKKTSNLGYYQQPQRTSGFHEMTHKEPVVLCAVSNVLSNVLAKHCCIREPSSLMFGEQWVCKPIQSTTL